MVGLCTDRRLSLAEQSILPVRPIAISLAPYYRHVPILRKSPRPFGSNEVEASASISKNSKPPGWSPKTPALIRPRGNRSSAPASESPLLLPRLGLDRVLLKSTAPWRQLPTTRKKGCQIDLLLQSERSVCIVEIKRRNTIGPEIEEEISRKIKALALPRDLSVRTALVYDGNLSPSVEARGYFDAIIPADNLLRDV